MPTVDDGYGMPLYTAEALVLRTYKLGEADRIVVFLTRDRGKKRGVAPNARRSRKRFGAALEPLTEVRVAYFEKERRELVGLNYAEPVRSPLSAPSPEALGYSHYFAELIDEWAADADVDERLFRLGHLGARSAGVRRAGRGAGAVLRVLAVAAAGRVSRRTCALSSRRRDVPRRRAASRAARRGVAWAPRARVLREIELIHRKLITMHLTGNLGRVRVINETAALITS